MTEEEKDSERKLKEEAVRRLRRTALSRYKEVWETDGRLLEYVTMVRKKPEEHNLDEVCAVLRFLELVRRYEWDGGAAKRFYRFYEQCALSSTTAQRKRYRLTPVQCFGFGVIYGLYEPEHKYNGYVVERRRLIREFWWFVPRKFAKTASAAVMAAYDLMFGDYNAEAYVASQNQEQSSICFEEIKGIMQAFLPDIEAAWRKDSNATRINMKAILFREMGRNSLAKCLTGIAKTKEGLRASLAIIDEYAQAEDTSGQAGSAIKTSLTSSFGTRKEPLCVVITTASKVTDGPCAQELEYLKRVMRSVVMDDGKSGRRRATCPAHGTSAGDGVVRDDHIFGMLFHPDVDDAPNSLRTWRKCQPHLGVTVQPDFYAMEWDNARKSADQMLSFMTRMLNVFQVDSKDVWIDPKHMVGHQRECAPVPVGKWTGMVDDGRWVLDPAHGTDGEMRARGAAHWTEDDRRGMLVLRDDEEVVGAKMAIDLSESGDLTTVTTMLLLMNGEGRQYYCVHSAFWMPDGADIGDALQPYDGVTFYSQHVNRNIYSAWARQGYLRLIHGPVIDYQVIADYVLEVANSLADNYGVQVSQIGYDKWKAVEMANMLKASCGESRVGAVPQTIGNYTAPCRYYEHWLLLGAIWTDPNPISAYNLGNARLITDNLENTMPTKSDPAKRIDSVMTTLMCVKMFIDG